MTREDWGQERAEGTGIKVQDVGQGYYGGKGKEVDE